MHANVTPCMFTRSQYRFQTFFLRAHKQITADAVYLQYNFCNVIMTFHITLYMIVAGQRATEKILD